MDNATPNMPEELVRYLDGEMNESERSAIALQLAGNTSLQQEYDSLLMTRESIRYYGLQQRVARIHQQMMGELTDAVPETAPKKKLWRYAVAVAASIVLIIGAYMIFSSSSLSSGKIYKQNYQAYVMPTVRDGAGVQTEIEKAYRAGNYAQVIELHDLGKERTISSEFLCSTAAMELNNDTKAIECLNEVLDMNKAAGTTLYNDEAEYYLALAYLREKEYTSSLSLLEKINRDPGHLYHDKVKGRFIEQVRKLK